MTVDLEQRLADLGSWLDLAAPDVTIAEVARAERPGGSPPRADADDAPVLALSSLRGTRRSMRADGRLLAVGAAAIVLLFAGLVAASRRPGPAGTKRPEVPAPSTTTVTSATTTLPAENRTTAPSSTGETIGATNSCASLPVGCTTTPAAVTVPPPPLVAALVLTADEVALLDAARQRSMATCMSAEGLPFTTAPDAGPYFGMGFLGEWFGEGLTVADATAHGYQQTGPPYDEAAAARYERAHAENSARVTADVTYERAIERCALAFVNALHGAGSDDFEALENSTSNALITVLKPATDAPAYRAALARWVTCARAAGLSDASPRNRTPFGYAVGAPPTEPPGPDERRQAVADAECRAQAQLQATLRTEAERLLDAWIAAHPGITERLVALRAAMLTRAGALAAG